MRRSHIYSKRIYCKYMKYLTQTTDITSEKIKDLDYGRVVLDTTTGSVYILGYGPKYPTVDLGLTSGTLWMDRNIGAEEITDNGLYFAWGETQGYTAEEIGVNKQFDGGDYKHYNYDNKELTKYTGSDGLRTLEETDDAVLQNTHKFYMPTIEQCVELLMETDVYLIKADGTEIHGTWQNGNYYIKWDSTVSEDDELSGIECRKKDDNNVKLFVPAAGDGNGGSLYDVGFYGYFWLSFLYVSSPYSAWYLYFDYYGADCYYDDRYYGYSVRGVVAASTNVSDAVAEVVADITKTQPMA